jgi:hypothetical protein
MSDRVTKPLRDLHEAATPNPRAGDSEAYEAHNRYEAALRNAAPFLLDCVDALAEARDALACMHACHPAEGCVCLLAGHIRRADAPLAAFRSHLEAGPSVAEMREDGER